MSIKNILPVLSAFFLFTSQSIAQEFIGTSAASSSQNIQIGSNSSGEVELILTGPSNVWFAFGFGNSIMNNTYSIVVDGNGDVSERKLGNHSAGGTLNDSFTVESNNVDGNTRTVFLSRVTLEGPNSDYFTFPAEETSYTYIWGVGSSANLGFHASRGAKVISISPSIGIEENTLANNTNVFPNPFTSSISISSSIVSTSNVQITLVSLDGKTVKSFSTNFAKNITIDTDNLQKGMYFLLLDDGENIAQYKLFK
jgi:hypothetical protein